MSEPYTAAQANADRRAIDVLLRPLNDALLARLGLTREEVLAMIRAGVPPPVVLATEQAETGQEPSR